MPFANTVKRKPFGKLTAPDQASTQPTVMIMAYDWGTGAHAVVSDRLSQALQKRGCKVLIFTDEQTSARMKGFTNIDGRCTTVTHFDNYINQFEEFKAALRQHQPDILITEHYPMEKANAIISADIGQCVSYARQISEQTKKPLQIHALVRDIPDRETLPSPAKLAPYDRLIVRGDEQFHSYATHFAKEEDWNSIKDKLHYVGYAAAAAAPSPKDNSVVVSLGGGLISGDSRAYENIMLAIEALPKSSELARKRWHIYAPHSLQNDLKEEAAHSPIPITIHPFDATFEQAMQRADMVICRGGMTAIEALANNIPALIIPRQYENGGEQKIRTKELVSRARDRIVVVDEKDMVIPNDLHEPMQRAYSLRHVRSSPPFALNGHEKAADDIIALAQGRQIQSIGAQGAHITR